jgi:hypothetical protein
MTMTNVTISFTAEQMTKLNQLMATRQNQTVEQVAATVVERGLYDLSYRTERNRKVWQQFKEYRKSTRG